MMFVRQGLVVTQSLPLLLKLASQYPPLEQTLWTVNITGHISRLLVKLLAGF